jgi:hypothetical protein
MPDVADRQHKHRDLWLVVVGTCLTLAGGTPVALWIAEKTVPSAYISLWPNPFIVAAIIVFLAGTYVFLALLFGWWLPGGFEAESPPLDHPVSSPAGSLPLTVTADRAKWLPFRDAGYVCAVLLKIENTVSQDVMVIRHSFRWFWESSRTGSIPTSDKEALTDEPRVLRESGNYEPALPLRNFTVPSMDWKTGWVMSACAGRGRPRCMITVMDALGNSYKVHTKPDDQDLLPT